ncbi:hypothetical protein BDBG_04318 [Blastomyces gilchristii SLH14081]|uniref:Uncharacterized protein n=1 Tax=Blastomyces gilchristii (strain SLH14081) TaxID=559298 RepID=A0A179UJZ0_BLAGS|nr:uncharacterized protein BDBG_04318 [Blastomyces gilchristii SLH14081]OAT08355.1 hypothetical protein BDBG_04318 [Blastomyces gilchristii SLH14081]
MGVSFLSQSATVEFGLRVHDRCRHRNLNNHMMGEPQWLASAFSAPDTAILSGWISWLDAGFINSGSGISRDFCFIWRFFIDNSMTWRYPSMAFNTIAIGLLRIAAWDLEVSSDSQIHYPKNRVNFPYWDAPQTDIFWFHGYLVVLHGNINTKSSILAAIFKAQFFLEVSHKDAAHLIILSLQHVAFVEISFKSVLCSQILPLFVNMSAQHCSPGFRLLSYVLSSWCWKPSLAHREHLRVGLPPETLDLILGSCSPEGALTLSQSSFIFQERYYSSIPQIQHFTL